MSRRQHFRIYCVVQSAMISLLATSRGHGKIGLVATFSRTKFEQINPHSHQIKVILQCTEAPRVQEGNNLLCL